MRTPEPRLPLEPEEYPLYAPPRRIGCSGLSIVTLIMLFVFAFLFWKVTPGIVKSVRSFSPTGLLSSDQGTPGATPDISAGAGTVVAGAPSATPTLKPPTPTPVRECVQVVKASITIRTQPKLSAPSALQDAAGNTVRAKPGTQLQLVEANPTPIKDTDGTTWQHVQLLPPDSRQGYVLESYLSPVPCP